jgi:tRNA 2-selenouridine synthase
VVLGINEFLSLRDQLPVADVRSEGEYAQGHMAGAVNIPILNDIERVAVGTDYKQKGQLEAIKTGFRLVGPRIIDIVTNAESVAGGRELLVHCWRGGMRSSNFCQFVGMAKVKTHQLEGGYKAYRHAALESFHHDLKLVVIGGSTGSGKSEILRTLKEKQEQVIDLESLASHRGSSFGGLMLPPQPTTEQFQNDLFEVIRTLDINRRVWIEDESIAVGKIFLPEPLWKRMGASPLIEVDVDKAKRVERLVNEYGAADKNLFLQAMVRITKKLGGQNFNAAKERLLAGDMYSTIEILLHYYDKAYYNGLSRKKNQVRSTSHWDGTDVSSIADELIKLNTTV